MGTPPTGRVADMVAPASAAGLLTAAASPALAAVSAPPALAAVSAPPALAEPATHRRMPAATSARAFAAAVARPRPPTAAVLPGRGVGERASCGRDLARDLLQPGTRTT
jgi:hypothetical protein